ncbi:MAG: MFS transporter, partial [Pseudomonadota bacterium]
MAGDCARNIALYRWYRFCQSLLFWQAVWFLYFQDRLSAAEAILLYVAYDLATTLLEVPSGYLSDRLGRRLTLIAAAVCALGGAGLIVLGDSFVVFVLAQGLIGASTALMSGTDSAFLYESLVAEGRAAETEAQEAAAWRFSFAGLGVSALV